MSPKGVVKPATRALVTDPRTDNSISEDSWYALRKNKMAPQLRTKSDLSSTHFLKFYPFTLFLSRI